MAATQFILVLVVISVGCMSLTTLTSAQRSANDYNEVDDGGQVSYRQIQQPQQLRPLAIQQIRGGGGGGLAPKGPAPTPVPILKQINKHNEDGSYTYGFEGADGTFKIETKSPTGEVKGKYGFIDDSGKVRVVEYGADKFGFQPAGEGITVAPPTLVDETTDEEALIEERYLQQQARPRPLKLARLRAQPQPQAQAQALPPAFIQHQPQQLQQPVEYPPVFTRHPAPVSRPLPQQVASPIQYARPAPQVLSQIPQQQSLQYRSPLPEFQPGRAIPSSRQDDAYQFQPQPQPQPQIQYVQQEAAPSPIGPVVQARRATAPRPAAGGGLLDELAREYALPQNAGRALHDISFGFY